MPSGQPLTIVPAYPRLAERLIVAVDTHPREHTALVLDAHGQPHGLVTIPNQRSGFDELQTQVRQLAELSGCVPLYALEDVGGVGRQLAHALLTAEQEVVAVNPVLTDRTRRQQPHPAKSDVADAQAIGLVVLTKADRLRPLSPQAPCYQALKELSRGREGLVKRQTQLKNQLHRLLVESYPGYRLAFPDPFSAAALAVWATYADPASLATVTTEAFAALLTQASHHRLGPPQAVAKLAALRATPSLDPPLVLAARASLIGPLVRELQLVQAEVGRLTRVLADFVAATGTTLTTIPGVGPVVAAMLLGELGDVARFGRADQLARYAGCAPLLRQSSQRGRHQRDRGGNRRLNHAFWLLARGQLAVRHGQPGSAAAVRYVAKKRAEGKTKAAARRCLMRRLVDIVYRVLVDRVPYREPQPTTADLPAA
jgi:transposase